MRNNLWKNWPPGRWAIYHYFVRNNWWWYSMNSFAWCRSLYIHAVMRECCTADAEEKYMLLKALLSVSFCFQVSDDMINGYLSWGSLLKEVGVVTQSKGVGRRFTARKARDITYSTDKQNWLWTVALDSSHFKTWDALVRLRWKTKRNRRGILWHINHEWCSSAQRKEAGTNEREF